MNYLPHCVSIGSVKAGAIARIRGRTRALGELVIAPLTGRTGVYFRAERQRDQGEDGIATLDEEEAWANFLIEDQTGSVIVQPRGFADVAMRENQSFSEDSNELRQRFDDFARTYGSERRLFFTDFGYGLRYREIVIPEGHLVTALGVVVQLDTAGAGPIGYRRNSAAYALQPPADGRLIIRG
jgi:hypothetical protein